MSAAATIVAGLTFAASAQGASWQYVVHPNVSGKTIRFQAAEAPADDDVWAAGYIDGPVGGAYEFRTMVQHWNGSSWTRENTRDRDTTPAQNLIWDISAPSDDNVWIVGHSAKAAGNLTSTPLVEHFDGTQWSIVDLPRQGSLESLTAVSAATDGTVWTAGSKPNSASGYYQPMLWKRGTGGGWSEVAVPKIAGCRTSSDGKPYESYPLATALRDGMLYLSGWCRTPTDSSRGWLLRRERGGGWRLLIAPDSLPSNSRLEGIDIAANGQARVVGSSATQGLSFRIGGTTVTPETVPGNPPLEDVAAGPAGTAFAIGYMTILARPSGKWLTETWSSPPGQLNAVVREPSGTAWAFGDAFDNTGLILRRAP